MNLLAITLAASLAAGGLAITYARAQDTAARPALRGRFLERAREKLGLSDSQVADIKGVLAAEKGTLTTLLTLLHDARVGLRTVIQKPGSSESEIRAASARVAAVEADLAVERAKLYGKISPILTADQLAKISEFQDRADDFVDGALKNFGDRLTQ